MASNPPLIPRGGQFPAAGTAPRHQQRRRSDLAIWWREIDRGFAVHARRGRHVGVEIVAGNDAHAVMLPAFGVGCGIVSMIVSMIVIM